MATYISSNENRFYAALESSYGEVASVTAVNRIPAVKLAIEQQIEQPVRRDKTGSRTFTGFPPGGRRRTTFELLTYLSSWQKAGDSPEGCGEPAYGPLFRSAMGGEKLEFSGGTVATSTETGRVVFESPHGLAAGQAVSCAGEIRFVAGVFDATGVQLNAPFTAPLEPGTVLSATVSYTLATRLPSLSIFDYWTPESAVQRIVRGAAIDELSILINGDFHGFRFRGIAQDVVDSSSYSPEESEAPVGPGDWPGFPTEPAIGAFDYAIVPGHMGQAWLGASPTQFFTITEATITLKNALDARAREFGSSVPRAIWPGMRSVSAAFELFTQDNEATHGLYQAARQQSPIEIMFQLGETEGQLMGVYLKSVVPELPEFDDGDSRLRWSFRSSRAQGTVDDEIGIAFA